MCRPRLPVRCRRFAAVNYFEVQMINSVNDYFLENFLEKTVDKFIILRYTNIRNKENNKLLLTYRQYGEKESGQ